MTTNSAELLPCPFCGCTPKLRQIEDVIGIECGSDCDKTGLTIIFPADKQESAIAAWNRRPAAQLVEGQQGEQTAPEGFVIVPKEPTEDMVVAGFESWPDPFFSKPEDWDAYEAMTGCQQAAHRARLCYSAMIEAAPSTRRRMDRCSRQHSE